MARRCHHPGLGSKRWAAILRIVLPQFTVARPSRSDRDLPHRRGTEFEITCRSFRKQLDIERGTKIKQHR
jgi:hypothetical protein